MKNLTHFPDDDARSKTLAKRLADTDRQARLHAIPETDFDTLPLKALAEKHDLPDLDPIETASVIGPRLDAKVKRAREEDARIAAAASNRNPFKLAPGTNNPVRTRDFGRDQATPTGGLPNPGTSLQAGTVNTTPLPGKGANAPGRPPGDPSGSQAATRAAFAPPATPTGPTPTPPGGFTASDLIEQGIQTVEAIMGESRVTLGARGRKNLKNLSAALGLPRPTDIPDAPDNASGRMPFLADDTVPESEPNPFGAQPRKVIFLPGAASPVDRRTTEAVLEAMSREFDEPTGIGPETWRQLQEAGLFRNGNDGLFMGSVRLFNEGLIGGAAWALDAAVKTLTAVEGVGIEAVIQSAIASGMDRSSANRLRRDLNVLSMVAAVVTGRPPKGSGRSVGARRPGIRKRRRVHKKHRVYTPDEFLKMGNGRGWKENREFITPSEFRQMPETGRLDPQKVRTSQSDFDERFKPEPRSNELRTLNGLEEDLAAGRILPDDVAPIRILEYRGHIYTADNRRLVVFRRLNIPILYQKVKLSDLEKEPRRRIRRASRLNLNGSFIVNKDSLVKE